MTFCDGWIAAARVDVSLRSNLAVKNEAVGAAVLIKRGDIPDIGIASPILGDAPFIDLFETFLGVAHRDSELRHINLPYRAPVLWAP